MIRFFVLLAAMPVSLAAQSPSRGLPQAAPEDVGLSSALLQRLTIATQRFIDSGGAPGAVVAVARHGKLAYLHAVGFADVQRKVPLPADAVFRIYSMTKPITAAAIAQLADRGALRYDDPVSRFIPAFASMRVFSSGPAARPLTVAAERQVTIRDLLTHTSGLLYAFGTTPVDSIYRLARLGSGLQSMARVVDSLAKLPLVASPGAAWNYSVASDVLGRIIEIAADRRLDEYLADEVFRPLAMSETGFHASPALAPRLVVEYVRGTGGAFVPRLGPRVWADYDTSSRFFSGGAGLLSTVYDYLRFAQMLLNGGQLDGVRILEPGTVDHMTRSQLPTTIPYIDEIFPMGFGHGYGAAVLVDPARARVPMSPGTFSWSGNAGTHFWIDREKQLIGVAMLQVQNA
ncbi:MAG TPA: serine hydrolase domain-containing protein, partial [Thermomicrobiales bacterium]|nr:serine hydrolase domain-containing protein [Thermomicrobiales bacterium]